MKVVHVVPGLFRKEGGVLGGAERYVAELARHMAERVPTRLVTFGPRDEVRREGKLDIFVTKPITQIRCTYGNPLSFRFLRWVLDADIVHCHQHHVFPTSLCALLAVVTRQRVFMTDLGGGGWDISGYISTDRFFQGELHLSQYSRRIRGSRQKNQYVIFGGVDTEKFKPSSRIRRTRRLLYVGRLLPHKGVDLLIEALTPSMELDVVGQPLDTSYLEVLKTLAHGKKVSFHFDVSDPELIEFYQRAAAIVLPSLYRDRFSATTLVPELLGQTLLEGMACGAPALCTDVASLPEIVRDGIEGYIVAPNDVVAMRSGLERLTQSEAASLQMGARARKRVLQEFTWPTVVDRCLNIYESKPMEEKRAA